MRLREYRTKRDFSKTAEPSGNGRRRRGHSLVIQKHAATRLHYDFRLEMDGVLKSWAVPKGPSLDPTEKRLAVEVEDHPLDYGKFEGTIPAGEYGGGTVMIWDYGTWEPQADPHAGYQEGKLKFTLDGQRLHGGWALVRIRNDKRRSTKPNWLLIKERDQWARPHADGDILEEFTTSAPSGRTMDEIAAGRPTAKKDRMTKQVKKRLLNPSPAKKPSAAREKRTSAAQRTKPRRRSPHKAARRSRLPKPSDIPGARLRTFPKHPRAQLATIVAQPPEGDEWFHEMKFDGYRMLCGLRHGDVHFLSRNSQDWTMRMQSLIPPAAQLKVREAVLDGEVVVLDSKGISSFQLLQNAFRGESQSPLVYFVFDLLYLDGYDLTWARLEDRKSLLEDLLKQNPASTRLIRYSEHVVGSGAKFKLNMCAAGLEGMVSKRRDAPYVPGRTTTWVKSKCRQGQEFVVGGYTRPSGSRIQFGALLAGYYRPDGKLAYAGRIGTGFNDTILRDLMRRLSPLRQSKSAFVEMPKGTRTRDVTWVRPELVGQVEFSNWTDEGLLRQASFQGLREDKPARDVRREEAKSLSV